MTTVSVTEDVRQKLLKVVSELQIRLGHRVELNEAIRFLVDQREKNLGLLEEACKPLVGAKEAVDELQRERKLDYAMLERQIMTEGTAQLFAKLLEERFSNAVPTTEDSVRYTFFYCLSTCGKLSPTDIIIEHDHQVIQRAKVDTYVPRKNGRPEIVIEFKFDRAIPSEQNSPKPQKAGKLFSDVMRLACFKSNSECQRFLVYVTDNEMTAYFRNPDNQLSDFFDLPKQKKLLIDKKYVNKHCQTFVKSVGSIFPSRVVCFFSKDFDSGMSLRIYEINPLSD